MYLTRIDPCRNCFRYYYLEQKGKTVLVKWGRNGFQRTLTRSFSSRAKAERYYDKQFETKLKKGYVISCAPVFVVQLKLFV